MGTQNLRCNVDFDPLSTPVPWPFHGVQIALPKGQTKAHGRLCSLVAVVIHSLPWNFRLQGN